MGKEKISHQWKTAIGIDLTYLIGRGGVGAKIEKQFSTHWSVEGYNEINIKMMAKGRNEAEIEHYNEFEETQSISDNGNPEFLTGGIRLKYWIKDPFKGCHIAAGCKCGKREGIRGTIGAGYTFQVWRNFTGSLSLETDIAQKSAEERNSIKVSLTLNYTF